MGINNFTLYPTENENIWERIKLAFKNRLTAH